jgi:hypothetical protein
MSVRNETAKAINCLINADDVSGGEITPGRASLRYHNGDFGLLNRDLIESYVAKTFFP